jgi:hypothetical protein
MNGFGLSLVMLREGGAPNTPRANGWSEGRASYTIQWLLGRPPARAMTAENSAWSESERQWGLTRQSTLEQEASIA